MKKVTINLIKIFFTLLLILNIVVLDSPSIKGEDANLNQNEVIESLILPKIYFLKAHYDQNGKFEGCWGRGSDCIAFPLFAKTITLTLDGVNAQ